MLEFRTTVPEEGRLGVELLPSKIWHAERSKDPWRTWGWAGDVFVGAALSQFVTWSSTEDALLGLAAGALGLACVDYVAQFVLGGGRLLPLTPDLVQLRQPLIGSPVKLSDGSRPGKTLGEAVLSSGMVLFDLPTIEPGQGPLRLEARSAGRGLVLSAEVGRATLDERTHGSVAKKRSDVPDFRVAFVPVGIDSAAAIRPGMTREMALSVSNLGGPGHAVRATIRLPSSVPGLEVPSAISLGDIASGETVRMVVPLKATKEVRDGTASLEVLVEDGLLPVLSSPVSLPVAMLRRSPVLNLLSAEPEFPENGGIVVRDRSFKFSCRLRNDGGESERVQVRLVLTNPDVVFSEDLAKRSSDWQVLEPFKQGQVENCTWKLVIKPSNAGSDKLPVQLEIVDAPGMPVRSVDLDIVLGQRGSVTGNSALAELERDEAKLTTGGSDQTLRIDPSPGPEQSASPAGVTP